MNNKLPNEIKKAIENDTLVLFIGAGISQPLGFPSWNGLVIEILEKLSDDKPSLKGFIPLLEDQTMSAIQVLEIIKDNKKEIYQIMKKRFLISIEDEKLSVHKKLWKISNKIITTNYDQALETSNPNISPVSYNYKFEMSQLTDENKYLFKLHGDIENINDCILFKEDYDKLYNNGEKSAIFQLKKIFTDYTIVFLGFSLSDPYVCSIFENMNKMFNGFVNKHFIVSMNDEDFGKYSTKTLKVDDWENSLTEKLDSMIYIKNLQIPSKEKAITLDAEEKFKVKIAILIASPIDKPYEVSLGEIIENFKNLDAAIDCYHLSVEQIEELDGYDYFIIFSQSFKNKICVEGEYFESNFISIKELQDSVVCENLKAIFLFTNDKLDIDDTMELPMFIYKYEKKNIKNVIFKTFRKSDKKFIEDNFECINGDNIELNMISSGKAVVKKNITGLPDLIDSKELMKFVGRSSDLRDIVRKIIDLRSKNQILTIKGSGGIGKTTIIKKVAYEFSQRNFFKDGIYFVDLEHIENYDQFEYKISQCFELDNTINFKEHIKLNGISKESLIILDNFETLLYINDSSEIKKLVEFISDYSTIVCTCREIIFDNSFFEDVHILRDFTTDEALNLFLNESKMNCNYEKDMKVLKIDILENLLNNNPLAIKIIAKNSPKNKDIKVLKTELEDDFFNTLDGDQDDIYIEECDKNIEKSKSLYQSINYSYKRLNNTEQFALQLLCLFPDGIDMENFKKFFKECSKKLSLSQIRDTDLKSLEIKSLVDLVNRNIRLQSIIRRFAEYQFNKRNEEEKVLFYTETFNYNSFLLASLDSIYDKNVNLAYMMFDIQSNNFLKSVSFINKFDDDKISKLEKLEYIHVLFKYTNSTYCSGKLLNLMNQLKGYFDDIEYGQKAFNIIKIVGTYYLKDFDNSFKKLKEIIHFDDFKELANTNYIIECIAVDAFKIYFLEGAAFEFCKWIIGNKMEYPITYNTVLFELGKYKKKFSVESKKYFFDFEEELKKCILDEKELEEYIDSVYSKDHLEKMQIYYLKSKIKKIDKETIDSLVVTNPYTLGLKNLMYAFNELDNDKAIGYYKLALKNLKHIKYYYVEAIYYFSNFLKNINNVDYDFWLDKGYNFAKQYYYGYLTYKFELLLGKTTGEYNEDNYRLPEELDFDGYAKFIGKNMNN